MTLLHETKLEYAYEAQMISAAVYFISSQIQGKHAEANIVGRLTKFNIIWA